MDQDQANSELDPTVLEALRRYFSKPSDDIELVTTETVKQQTPTSNRWLWVALICFLSGQFLIEFLREALGGIGVALLIGGVFLFGFAFLRGKKQISVQTENDLSTETHQEINVRLLWLLVAFIMAFVASLNYRQGRFNFLSALLWFSSIAAIVAAFFQPETIRKPDFKQFFSELITKPGKLIAYILLIAVVLVFQLGRLQEVPPEIISSQVEAFYTVDGILNGDASLWFPRNVISEPISYYWAAIVSLFTLSPLNFAGLKLAYGMAGLVSVFFMYKLGRRFFDEQTGFISALMLAVSFWSILQQRALLGFGLVLPLMLPALYYLYKSLQEDDINSLLIASVLTGFGLLTNKIFIVLVFANLLITIVYLTRSRAFKSGINIYMRIGIGLITGLVVALPLIFVIAANPINWLSSIVNQLSIVSNPDADSYLVTFFGNAVSALGLMNWFNRSSWVDGIPNRAALDWVSGAFFLFGLCVTFFHDLFNKQKQTISLLILFSLMLLPSVLSIAYPMENPSLSRALGSSIPVFLIAGRGFTFAIDRMTASDKSSQLIKKLIIVCFFVITIILHNFGLINSIYVSSYRASAWNASEMAEVIRNYDIGQAGYSHAYIVGYPHWVDARSVAISMDRPYTNLSILPEDLGSTVDLQTAKIFLLHIADTESLSQLQSLYPGGTATTYQSIQPEKNFVIYIASQ